LPGVIRATLRPVDKRAPPSGYTAAVLEAIGEHYPTSEPVTLGEYTPVDHTLAVAAAFTALQFTVTDSGAVDDLRIVATSLSPSFDHSVIAAVRAAGADRLPPKPRNAGGRTQFQLEVATAVQPDTERDAGDTAGAARMPWVVTQIPAWSDAVAAGTVRGRSQVPFYPPAARRQSIEDSVLIQFAIGANGRIAPHTAILLHASYRDFVSSIADKLSSFRYVPTTINGCPVASLAQEPFTFKIQRW
jgi:TonB family protein